MCVKDANRKRTREKLTKHGHREKRVTEEYGKLGRGIGKGKAQRDLFG